MTAPVVARHEQAVGRYVEVLCLDHYLEVLATKPGALPGRRPGPAKTRGVFTGSHQTYWDAARIAPRRCRNPRLITVLLAHRNLPPRLGHRDGPRSDLRMPRSRSGDHRRPP